MSLLINNRFKIVNSIGRGSQATTYLAEDMLQNNEKVVIKVYSQDIFLERCLFEFRRLASLNHPSVVTIHSFGKTEINAKKCYFIAEQWVKGTASDKFFASKAKLPAEKFNKLFEKFLINTSQILDYIHSKGIYHRDIKPCHIILSPGETPDDFKITLIDFGLSTSGSKVNKSVHTPLCGTAGFIAPECINGSYSHLSELFSFGITAYLVAGGKLPPLNAQKAPMPYFQITDHEIENHLSHLKHPYRTAIKKLIDEAPAKRFPSARALYDFLIRSKIPQEKKAKKSSVDFPILIKKPEFTGREKQLGEIIEILKNNFITHEKPPTHVIVIKGSTGTGKTTLIEETKKNFYIHLSKNPPAEIPSFIETTISEFMKQMGNCPDPVHEQLTARGSSPQTTTTKLISYILKISPAIFILNNPDEKDTILLKEIIDRTSFKGAKFSLPATFIIEINSELNKTPPDICRCENVKTYELNPLPEEEIKKIITSACESPIAPSLLKEVATLSDGNPLIAIQFLQFGPQRREKNLPFKPYSFIRSWAEKLSEPSKNILLIPAISIEKLSISDIAKIAGIATEDAQKIFNQFSASGMIRYEGEKVVVHPLLRSVINETISPAQDKSIHNKIYNHLINSPHHFAPVAVNYHGIISGRRELVKELIPSVEADIEKGDSSRIVPVVQNVIRKSSGKLLSSHRANLMLLLARALRLTGRYDLALKTLQSITHPPSERNLHLQIACERGLLLRLKGQNEKAQSILSSILKESLIIPELHAKIAFALSRIYLENGEVEKAIETTRLALKEELPQQLKLPLFESLSLSQIAIAQSHNTAELKSQAEKTIREGIEISEKLNLPQFRSRFYGMLGFFFHRERKFREAIDCYKRAIEIANSTDDYHSASVYRTNLGTILMEEANFSEAMDHFNSCIAELESTAPWREYSALLLNKSNLQLRIGDMTGARKTIKKCSEICTFYDFKNLLPFINMIEGDSYLYEGKFQSASEKYDSAEKLFERLRNEEDRTIATISKIHALTFGSRIDEAEKLANELMNKNINDMPQWIQERFGLAFCHLCSVRKKKIDEAIEICLTSLKGFRSRKESQLVVRGEIILAKLLLLKGAGRSALKFINSAISTFENIRNQSLKLGYDPEKYDPYLKLLNEVIKMKDGKLHQLSIDEETKSHEIENRWKKLAIINKKLNSELRVRPLLEFILEVMIEITGAARGFIILLDKNGQLRIKCARNISSQGIQDSENSFSRSIVKKVLETCQPLITVDALSDSKLSSSQSILDLKLKSVLSVPLIAKGKLLGAIYVDNPYRSNIFTDEDVGIVTTFADQAAIALDNAELMTQNKLRESKIKRLNRKLEKLIRKQKVELEAMRETIEKSLPHSDEKSGRFSEIVGQSEAVKKIFRLIDRIASTDLPVVIIGESGTGKELVARSIHRASSRRKGPFVAENCGAIPDTLLESILFGHAKGAFTGADRARAGLFEMASGGTLFLDEIASMSLSMQTKLLRTLQDGTIRPLGEERVKKVEVRVIAATTVPLDQLVKEGNFRQDLYYRINVVTIELPPLRMRKQDIPLLANHFIKKHCGERKIEISAGAMKKLLSYSWPGNVRQLENEIMKAIVLCEGRIMEEDILTDVPMDSVENFSPHPQLTLKENVEQLEKILIKQALMKTGGNQSRAAKLLGISRFGLIKKINRYRLEV